MFALALKSSNLATMKQLYEFFPIVLFFIAYKAYDIYVATATVIVATIIQVAFAWFRHRKVEPMQWITLGLVVVMGGLTLYLQDEQFIKWKLSIIEWLFGLAFLGSHFFGKKNLIERMMSASLSLPEAIWKRLNLMWGCFFMAVGFINLYVMFNFSTDDWVTFKTFGVPGLMVLFIAVQMAFLYKHIPETEK
ncbi:septation protein A [Methylosoma difficile]